jgi:hypothetical protein
VLGRAQVKLFPPIFKTSRDERFPNEAGRVQLIRFVFRPRLSRLERFHISFGIDHVI